MNSNEATHAAIDRVTKFIKSLPPHPVVSSNGGHRLFVVDLLELIDAAKLAVTKLTHPGRCAKTVVVDGGAPAYCRLDKGHSGDCR